MASSVRLPSRVGHALFLDQVAPQTRLLEKRRQMFEVRRLSGTVGVAKYNTHHPSHLQVQEALESQKEEFSRREEAFRLDRWDQLSLTPSVIRACRATSVAGAARRACEEKTATFRRLSFDSTRS